MRLTTRLLLATAAALAAIPGGAAHAAPVCARVDVVVPGPVIGYGECVATPFSTYCATETTFIGSVGVVVVVCYP
ncbi:MAG TPA: hypothetical protein VNA20_08390 [Frankiaceae bacterium]|nr:hypothetical protein [Frankiaceae bacterium]